MGSDASYHCQRFLFGLLVVYFGFSAKLSLDSVICQNHSSQEAPAHVRVWCFIGGVFGVLFFGVLFVCVVSSFFVFLEASQSLQLLSSSEAHLRFGYILESMRCFTDRNT